MVLNNKDNYNCINIMKRFLLIAAASVLLLGACSKNEVKTEDNLIGFGSYTGLSTKANDTFVTNLVGKHFGVYAYALKNTAFADGIATSTPGFMTNVDVNYDGPECVNYSPLRYWPADNSNKLSFYGYYPYGDAKITSIPGKETVGMGEYGFSAVTDPTQMTDFMVSDVAADQYYTKGDTEHNGVVNLNFHHLLCQVRVGAKMTLDVNDPSTVVKFYSVTFNNVNSKGTVSLDATKAIDSDWTSTTPANYTISTEAKTMIEKNLAVPDDGTSKVSETVLLTNTAANNNGVFLMIPQTTPADATDARKVTATIVYGYSTDGGMEVIDTITTSPFTLEWGINKVYTYIFNIDFSAAGGDRAIKFTATVDNWDANKDIIIGL